MLRTRALILLCTVLFASFRTLATAQEGDILILNGRKYEIFTNPLRGYLDDHPGKLPRGDVISTANWRGYIATWEIKHNHLVLTDVRTLQSVERQQGQRHESEYRSVMAQMFPDQEAVTATWFSGHIIVPDGKLVHYVHMGYASTFERYILLRVEEGTVTRQWKASYKEFLKFRDQQFAAFKKTEEYRKALEETAKEGGSMSARENEEFLREFYSARYMSLIFEGSKGKKQTTRN
jgi:hypothetical protein